MGYMKQFLERSTNNNISVYIDNNKDIELIFRELENRKIPKSYSKDFYRNSVSSLITITLRNIYNRRYAFPLISKDWTEYLVKNIIKDSKCLEIMSGSGMLSYALLEAGATIISTDNFEWSENIDHYSNWKRKTFTHIEVMDAIDAIKKFGKEVEFIIMSWPPYNEPIAYEVLKTMREVNPNLKLIFIGEDYGGCTADDNFFDNVKEIEDKEIINHLDYINDNLFKSFDGIHDRIFIFK